MKKISQFKLNTKLLMYIITAIVVIYAAIFTYIGFRMGPVLGTMMEKTADNAAANYANLFKSNLTESKQISRTIGHTLETFLPLNPTEKINRTVAVLERLYQKNPGYMAVYASWERKYVDSLWTKDYGRIRVTLFSPPSFSGDISNVVLDTLNTYGDDVNGSYYGSKINPVDELANPYEDVYFGKEQTVTSVFNPMVYNGKFLGSTGIDIPLSEYSRIIKNAEKSYNSSIFLLANDGIFVGNQREEMVGMSITDVIPDTDLDLIKKIKNGEKFSMYVENNGDDYYVAFYPMKIVGVDTPWSVGVAVPKKEMIKLMKTNFIALFIVSLLGILAMIIIIYFLSKGITGPITHITHMLKLMSEGKINKVDKMDTKREDEIGEIIDSTNRLVENLRNTAVFAHEIGEGSLDTEFETLNEDDVLGNSLLNMRTSLQKAKIEEEKRRKEEEKQNWATVGYAKFGELLRNSTENMEDFTYNVISNLVKYTNSNQGALFLLNVEDEQDQYLTMSSCYAYNRKKYVDRRIEVGSNLVGQCFLEAETIYMTDIPEDYINITSGLGDANPNALVIVPLKFNDKVFGVIELASFHAYEKHQIEFVEKLAESIASTISTVRVNLQTIQLLEESKLKSEELAAQEEEMRQNMEELQTTQEESARRELDMNGILGALNSSYLVMELNLDAEIININENAKKLLGINGIVEGQNLRSFLKPEELDEFEDVWQRVVNGESVHVHHNINRAGKLFIISESYNPIFNEVDEIYKVLNLGVELEH